ncbi:sarcosine oxidase subunit gamma [Celeribacter sp. HF31]|uniref:sarcosine oxidase subunit gamma n=1 Tax=Celeribacter sp. HF31 TaxID=2721558 RepID=UPI001431A951|nr:sarcosine oxidase subunit gamma family protein [Celeribacter sp. HF31]NIY80072.1 sarcosine oxidase subunit gamma [Celeribacter sp. HF31]
MSKHISSLAPSVVVDTAAARVAVSQLIGRISLRARTNENGGDLAAVGKAIGLELPTQIGTRAKAEGIEAACLGPDEWTVLVPLGQIEKVEDALAALYPSLPHSMTDITGREVTLTIEGPQAAELLSIGAPRDIASIKVGQARRMLFDGATVTLWRDSDTSFRMDVWNSFASFLVTTLETGAKELAAELA